MLPTSLTPTPARLSPLDHYFGLSASGVTVAGELRAGLTTFLTMSYLLFVNPQLLAVAIPVPQAHAQLLVATALTAAFGSLTMGLIARHPFALAPGMGLNAYFAYTVVGRQGVPWQTALGAAFLAGLVLSLLSLLGVRRVIVQALPDGLKFAITAGIGAFLTFLGLQGAGLVVADPATLLRLGDPTAPTVWVAGLGLVVTAALLQRRVRGALLYGLLTATLFAVLAGLPVYGEEAGRLAPFAGFHGRVLGVFELPVWPGSLAGQLDLSGAGRPEVLGVVFAFVFVMFFDITGTLTGLAHQLGVRDNARELPRIRRTFALNGVATSVGAALGISPSLTYAESASGLADGGRTGLTAVTVGGLFLLSLFLAPLVGAVPPAALAPALILVGSMMMGGVSRIDWADPAESVPAVLTVLAMPLTSSIADGVSLGVISACAIKGLGGQARQVSPLLYALAALLALRYALLPL